MLFKNTIINFVWYMHCIMLDLFECLNRKIIGKSSDATSRKNSEYESALEALLCKHFFLFNPRIAVSTRCCCKTDATDLWKGRSHLLTVAQFLSASESLFCKIHFFTIFSSFPPLFSYSLWFLIRFFFFFFLLRFLFEEIKEAKRISNLKRSFRSPRWCHGR